MWLRRVPEGEEWQSLASALPVVRAMLIGTVLAGVVGWREILAVTRSLFEVPAAWALLGGIGGSTGGIRSEFSALALFGVNIAFTVQPPATVTVCATPPCGAGFSTTVQATSATPAGTFTVGGTTLHLIGINNNGTPTEINQCIDGVCTNDPVATTDNAGVATFAGLSVTKPGAIKFVITNGAVNGRAAIAVGSATSNKTNVKP